MNKADLDVYKDFIDRARRCFMSATCYDSNLENAGLTDGLFAIADAINNLAKSVDVHAAEVQHAGEKV